MSSIKRILKWNIDKDDRYYKSQKLLLLHEIISNFAYSVVDGVFLSSLLILLGASNFFIALMFSVAVFCSITQIFTPAFYERHKLRKSYMMLFLGIHRIVKCCIIFIPLIFPRSLWMPLIFITYLISNISASFNSPAHNNFCMSLLKKEAQYWFMPLRQASTMLLTVLVYAIMGKILDVFNNSYTVYLVAYILSFITSVLSLIIFSRIEEPENEVTVLSKSDYIQSFINVFKDVRYMKLMLFTLVFYFAFYMSSSFKTIYMLKNLKSSYSFVTNNESLVYVVIIAMSILLVKLSEKTGWEKLLKYSMLFYIAHFIMLALTGPNTFFMYILHSITLGIAAAAFNLSILNYRFQIMPETNKTFYDSVFGVIFGAASLAAPFAGSWIQNLILDITSDSLLSFKVLFYFSSLLVFVSCIILIRSLKFKKAGTGGMVYEKLDI